MANATRDAQWLREWAIGVPMESRLKLCGIADLLEQLQREQDSALEALRLAQRWLANCVPVTDIDGPKPLPVIAAVLRRDK